MSNETNNTNVTDQKPNAVITDNAKYYPQQPQNHENDANLNASGSSPEKVKNVHGVVSNCKQLNVRREAQKRADNVLCVVSAGDVLLIDEKQSTNAWFYVTTADGTSGYCMKEFVTVG